CLIIYIVLVLPRTPRYTLSPYTTLFRSTSFGRRHSFRPTSRCLGLCGLRRDILQVALSGLICIHKRPIELWLHWEREGRRVTKRSEEHTSELQSRENLVCRLLLEKKKIK